MLGKGGGMKVTITVKVPGKEPVHHDAEVKKVGDTAAAIHEALKKARKANPGCSIYDSTIKLKSRE
jgi:Ser/Thr protein kinase RdoA (MazF antagonist)